MSKYFLVCNNRLNVLVDLKYHLLLHRAPLRQTAKVQSPMRGFDNTGF